MKILHCREVLLISIETWRGIIILSMIQLYCNFIHGCFLKVAFDLLLVCEGKRFPCKDQINIIKDLKNAEWKYIVGKNGILKESKRTFQKKVLVLNTKPENTFLEVKKIFMLWYSCCLHRAAGPSAPWENKEVSYLGYGHIHLVIMGEEWKFHSPNILPDAQSVRTSALFGRGGQGYLWGNSCYYQNKRRMAQKKNMLNK